MKQEVDIVFRLKLEINSALSKDQLIQFAKTRLRAAFAQELSEVLHPITVLSLREESAIYGNELPTCFDEYEVSGVREFDDSDGKYCERVPDDEAEFWSLYGYIPGEGVDCIGNFRSRRFAEEVYARITGRAYSPTRLKGE